MTEMNGYKIALFCILFLGASIQTIKVTEISKNAEDMIAKFLVIWLIRSIMGTLLFFA